MGARAHLVCLSVYLFLSPLRKISIARSLVLWHVTTTDSSQPTDHKSRNCITKLLAITVKFKSRFVNTYFCSKGETIHCNQQTATLNRSVNSILVDCIWLLWQPCVYSWIPRHHGQHETRNMQTQFSLYDPLICVEMWVYNFHSFFIVQGVKVALRACPIVFAT